jgi:hypothetical protein
MGEMKRANAYEEQRRMTDRFASTLVIAASIIAAVRLARDDISKPSPRLTAAIADSVQLARMVLERVALILPCHYDQSDEPPRSCDRHRKQCSGLEVA